MNRFLNLCWCDTTIDARTERKHPHDWLQTVFGIPLLLYSSADDLDNAFWNQFSSLLYIRKSKNTLEQGNVHRWKFKMSTVTFRVRVLSVCVHWNFQIIWTVFQIDVKISDACKRKVFSVDVPNNHSLEHENSNFTGGLFQGLNLYDA